MISSTRSLEQDCPERGASYSWLGSSAKTAINHLKETNATFICTTDNDYGTKLEWILRLRINCFMQIVKYLRY